MALPGYLTSTYAAGATGGSGAPGPGDWQGQINALIAAQQQREAAMQQQRQAMYQQQLGARPPGSGAAGAGGEIARGYGAGMGGGSSFGHQGYAGTPELNGHDAGVWAGRIAGAAGLPLSGLLGRQAGGWLTPYDVYNRHGQSTGPSVQQYGVIQGAGPFGLPLFTQGGSGSQHDAGPAQGQADGAYGQGWANSWDQDQAGFWNAYQPDLGMSFDSSRGIWGNGGGGGGGGVAAMYGGGSSPWSWGEYRI